VVSPRKGHGEGKLTFDGASFKDLEYAGWQKGAASYDELFGSVTRHAIDPLLDATNVRQGSRVLEVCCGVGYGAGAALARGAKAVGIDFAPAMVESARRRYPGAQFHQDDAEELSFDDETFDAVICAFGVNHLQQPERAIGESHRVLRSGGTYGFTMWCVPGKSKFHGLVLESIRAHGTLNVSLPPAPPPFRFSEPEVCIKALLEAGFVNPRISELALAFRPEAPEQVLDLTYSAVRLEMILSLQTERARKEIHKAIIDGAERFRTDKGIKIPMPAVLAVGEKSV
jgi:SAM-dependent methyltransferase